jgi:hypothetical protein
MRGKRFRLLAGDEMPSMILRFFARRRFQRPAMFGAGLLAASCMAPQPSPLGTPSADQRVNLRQLVNPAVPFGVSVVQDGPAPVVAGQPVRVLVSATAPGFAGLWHIGSAGEIEQLFAATPIAAGQTVSFPPQGAPYRARYGGPAGIETFIAAVSVTPVTAFDPRQYVGSGDVVPLPDTPADFVSRLSGQLHRLPPDSWNTATATVPMQSL